MASLPNISARQCKAARELLGWNQLDLAVAVGLSPATVKNYERGAASTVGTAAALRQTFECAGIRFILETANGAKTIGVTVVEQQ